MPYIGHQVFMVGKEDLNFSGPVEVPTQHPFWALQAGAPHPCQGKSQGRQMDDKAAMNMELEV